MRNKFSPHHFSYSGFQTYFFFQIKMSIEKNDRETNILILPNDIIVLLSFYLRWLISM